MRFEAGQHQEVCARVAAAGEDASAAAADGVAEYCSLGEAGAAAEAVVPAWSVPVEEVR